MIPRATPVAAPAIKARMVTLVMEGVLPGNSHTQSPENYANVHKAHSRLRIDLRTRHRVRAPCKAAPQIPPDPRRFNDPHPEQSLNDKTLGCFIAHAKQPSWVGRASRMVQ
jgi:hypothetical protein